MWAFFLQCLKSSCRLAVVKEEKEAMSNVLEQLQVSRSSSTPGREDWKVRDAVRTLQEQLVKERAKNQRSASKRCQEQRLLLEQVQLSCFSKWLGEKYHVLPKLILTFFLLSWLVGGAESLRVCSPHSCQESHHWTCITSERVSVTHISFSLSFHHW